MPGVQDSPDLAPAGRTRMPHRSRGSPLHSTQHPRHAATLMTSPASLSRNSLPRRLPAPPDMRWAGADLYRAVVGMSSGNHAKRPITDHFRPPSFRRISLSRRRENRRKAWSDSSSAPLARTIMRRQPSLPPTPGPPIAWTRRSYLGSSAPGVCCPSRGLRSARPRESHGPDGVHSGRSPLGRQGRRRESRPPGRHRRRRRRSRRERCRLRRGGR
jgi:hypothetical protein